MSFKCFLSEDGISSKSYIIVLQPERNKYLKWELPSPQATVDLIKSENIKLPVNSYTIFKLNCASAIRESHNFITDTSEVEIIKTTIAIWNCAEESIKEKYNQLNMDLRDLESSAHSGLPEVTPEVMVPGSPLSLNSESGNMTYSSVETSPVLNQDPPMVLIKPPFPPTINIDDLVTSKPNGDKPSKTSNAFIIYRKAYVKELHSRGNYLQMAQISPMVSESWKQEPDSVKAEYKRLAEAAKKRYKEMWPSKQRRRQQRKQQQQQQQLPQSLFIDSKPTNELGLSKLTQTPPQTAIDINQCDFSQSSLWPHQAISPLQNLTEASFGNLKDKRARSRNSFTLVLLEAKKVPRNALSEREKAYSRSLRFYSDYSEVKATINQIFYRELTRKERSQLERENQREKALKWNKIFNTEFIPIKRVLQLSECRKERKKVLKREFKAIKKALFQECEKERKKVLKNELRKVMKVLRLSAGSPGAYSWNLFQQLDKDVFGAIKRGIEELEKVKVAKCNQEGYCEKCGTKYTQIMTVDTERKRKFQINPKRLVRERESADEEDQMFNKQRFEQVNANNNAKMGSEVWQNLHEGTDCPQEFHKKEFDGEVYAHNDRLVKDTSNAQKANQQTCRQCKTRFMREQNYISDYVHDAHRQREFHKKQIYKHEPKESGEVDSTSKISNNHVHDVHSMNDYINQNQNEHDFQSHRQHEPKEKIVNQTFNIDNTINEAICDYNNHIHDAQFSHQKQIYEHEPKEKGDIDAIHNLGECYYYGKRTENNENKAFELYKEAAEKGQIDAINNLGHRYQHGIGTEKDENRAFELYNNSAENGNTDAIYNLANCYENGIGTQKDKIKAFELYKEAAEKGDIYAINLGYCYRNGIGTEAINNLGICQQNGIGTDKIKAFEFYQEAAEKGIIQSIYRLGEYQFHSWSFFKIGFQNGIRKKLAFTFRRKKIYRNRNKFINRNSLDHQKNDCEVYGFLGYYRRNAPY